MMMKIAIIAPPSASAHKEVSDGVSGQEEVFVSYNYVTPPILWA